MKYRQRVKESKIQVCEDDGMVILKFHNGMKIVQKGFPTSAQAEKFAQDNNLTGYEIHPDSFTPPYEQQGDTAPIENQIGPSSKLEGTKLKESASIVSTATVNRILSGFFSLRVFGDNSDADDVANDFLALLGGENLSELGRKMFKLNYLAVFGHYDETDPTATYKFEPVRVLSKFQAYKSLLNWASQCIGSSAISEETESTIVGILDDIACLIVESTPEFADAEWD